MMAHHPLTKLVLYFRSAQWIDVVKHYNFTQLGHNKQIRRMVGVLLRAVKFVVSRGERAKRASLDEDEHTRDESCKMATDGYIHY